MKIRLAFVITLLLIPPQVFSWGFFGHQRINRFAVFTLPPEMIGFYKKHLTYITENAVNPDKRRYMIPQEGPRHFIDLDVYGDSAAINLPRTWQAATAKYS
ncbi:MAG: S1/P1 Nuclease, partial [Bacteroidota bacterium]|nr:S1/P1 Nuclease [Bacteroidota bacterium]